LYTVVSGFGLDEAMSMLIRGAGVLDVLLVGSQSRWSATGLSRHIPRLDINHD